MSYQFLSSHRSMAQDAVRNAAYGRALDRVVTGDTTVLDVGSGIGVLGLYAARRGARRVYCVEPEDVISVCRELAERNGVADRVVVLQGTMESLELPERVDVIVSVLTGNFLVTEDLLPALFLARDRYLKPGGALIPSAGVMEAVPVEAPDFHRKHVASWSETRLGLDLGPVRAYTGNTLFYNREELSAAVHLAEPAELARIDFLSSRYESIEAEAAFRATRNGHCHGLVGWTRILLGEEWLSTAPHEPAVHWLPIFLPVDPPLPVAADDEIALRLRRPPYGEWTWVVTGGGDERHHSTFFSFPATAATVRAAALDAAPALAEEGRAHLFLLTRMDGTRSTRELAEALAEAFPRLYGRREKALDLVQTLVRRLC